MLLQNKDAWDKAGYSDAERREQAEILARKHYVHRNAYAYSSPGNGIFVNADRSAADINSHLRRDVRAGFHPAGCETVKSIVDHEIGHQLDDLLHIHRNAKIKKIWARGNREIKSGLSEYGTENINEMIAEGWSEYRNNPAPRPLAKEIGEVVIKLYEAREKKLVPPKPASGSTKER
jgi:hypothetical protein